MAGDITTRTLSDYFSKLPAGPSERVVTDDLKRMATANFEQASEWAEVARTGSFNDLVDVPPFPDAQVNADWNSVGGASEILNKPVLGGAAALSVGTTAGTVAAGNDSRIVAAVPNTRSVIAGTGLSGGGPLSANVTLALSSTSQAALELAGSALQFDDVGDMAFKDKVYVEDIAASGLPDATTFLRGDGQWRDIGEDFGVLDITAGENISIDKTDPQNPIISAVGGASGGQVNTVVGGTSITVDSTDPINPIVSATVGTAAGTVAAGNDTRIVNATPNTRTITAGTGLTGGGNLTANRTLALSTDSIASLAAADTAVQPVDLASVATSGSYNDLSGLPTLGTAAAQDTTAFAPSSHVGAGGTAHAVVTTSVNGFMSSADKTKLDSVSSGAAVTSVAGKTGVVTLAKADVGLANVDNTSDANKPVSTATQTALDLKANAATTYTKTEIDNMMSDQYWYSVVM
jgi:hypothetical protein